MAITAATVSRELSALHLPSRSLAHGRLCCRITKSRNSFSSRQASPLTCDPSPPAVLTLRRLAYVCVILYLLSRYRRPEGPWQRW